MIGINLMFTNYFSYNGLYFNYNRVLVNFNSSKLIIHFCYPAYEKRSVISALIRKQLKVICVRDTGNTRKTLFGTGYKTKCQFYCPNAMLHKMRIVKTNRKSENSNLYNRIHP